MKKTICLFFSIALLCGQYSVAQSLFESSYISGIKDENTISQAVQYSNALYDLLPAYVETDEERIEKEILDKYYTKHSVPREGELGVRDILTPCFKISKEVGVPVVGGVGVHSDQRVAIERAAKGMRIEMVTRLVMLSMQTYNEKTFVEITDFKRYFTSVYEIANLLADSVEILCEDIDSVNNYYVAECFGRVNRDFVKNIAAKVQKDSIDFQKYYSANPSFQTWVKKEIMGFKKNFYLYDSNSPLVIENSQTEEVSKEEEKSIEELKEKFKKALLDALNEDTTK